MSKSSIQQVREAIFDVMGEGIAMSFLSVDEMCPLLDAVYDETIKKLTDVPGVAKRVKQLIAENTYTGKNDPGQWSPHAKVVIHCENALNSGHYDSFYSEKWFEVTNKLDGLFCQNINAAVIGVYKT